MSFCACIDFYRRRTSINNMATFREAVMLKIALARRRRRNLYQIYQDRCFWAPMSGCSCINSCTRKTEPNSLSRLPYPSASLSSSGTEHSKRTHTCLSHQIQLYFVLASRDQQVWLNLFRKRAPAVTFFPIFAETLLPLRMPCRWKLWAWAEN